MTTSKRPLNWDDDTAIEKQTEDIDIPAWVDSDIDSATVDAIYQGGCSSGAYMPAVTYHLALATMAEHGDDVLEYIEEQIGELPEVEGESWSGMACKYLSSAVELWASGVKDTIDEIKTDIEAQQSDWDDEHKGNA